MKKNEVLENIEVQKLIFGGKALALAPDGKKIILTGGSIPGSVVDVRILKSKNTYYEGQEIGVKKRSPHEIPLPDGFQLYGGAKWLTLDYAYQLQVKSEQVRESFHHIMDALTDTVWHPIVPSPELYGYRNKVEFSWGKYISHREGIHDEFCFGFHAQGQFDRIIDCTYCALADEETNALFHEIDRLSRASGFSTYDPHTEEGFWRHLVVRKTKKTNQIMLVFSVNGVWKDTSLQSSSGQGIEDFFADMVRELSEKYPNITSIYYLENTGKADIVTGIPYCIFGVPMIEEELLGYRFEIQPKSFFQVNTYGAERLYTLVAESIRYKSDTTRSSVLLDLYAGTGTIGILLSKYFDTVYSVELVADASRDGARNAKKNGVTNVRFICEKAEIFAEKFLSEKGKADTIVIDPPRDGMHPSTLPCLVSFGAREIIYVSCNPSTLARDIEFLIGKRRDEKYSNAPIYRVTDITPVDMFPHTHHIETVVRLEMVG